MKNKHFNHSGHSLKSAAIEVRDALLPLSVMGFASVMLLLLVFSTGCSGRTMVDASNIEQPLNDVADRHDEYTRNNEDLSDLEERADLRDTELLREIIDQALTDDSTTGN